ncbi:MAG: hypothetical protein KC646_05610 [Candidatus Cloacimonetes bacterium]|nr:hypothetical protein [Candidatus Cloacimonadota bacterium]
MKRLLAFIVLVLNISQSEATIEYAKKEKKSCIHCHFTPRGGPRNFLGHYYSKNGYSFRDTIYGRPSFEKQAPLPEDISFKRPTAEGRLVQNQLEILKSIHYRAFSASNYYTGGQLVDSGKSFTRKLDLAGIAYNKNLEEMLVREFFGMGQYHIKTLALNSGMGLSMDNGPLIHLKSRNEKMDPAKYLAKRLDYFRKTSGYTGTEKISPLYAEFTSGDPHYTAQPNFKTGENQTWNRKDFDKTVSTESLGMGIFAKSMLAKQYLDNVNTKGIGVTPKAGFLGQVLFYEAINSMLWIRYGLGFDGANFKAFPPDYYDTRQLMYLPHKLVIEFDEGKTVPKSYFVKERLSHLRDLSAVLLGVSEFYGATDPHKLSLQKVFGNGPDDSKDFPFSYNSRFLAKELVLICLKNIEMLHFDKRHGAAYSTATLVKPIKFVKTRDIALTLQALSKTFKYFYEDTEIRYVTGNLIYAMSQFLVQNLQAIDGGVATSFDVNRLNGDFLNRTLEDQALAVHGLLEAFKVTREARIFRAAIRAYEFMANKLWDEKLNTFKTHEESLVLKITPENVGATIGALREVTLATGDLRTFAYLLAYFEGIMKNYSLQLSELAFTGEKVDDVKDSDGDNIIQSDKADGKFGIAPVLAKEVQVEPIVKW